MSKLNCKPGDIARVISGALGNRDKLVRVIEPSPGNGLPVGSVFIVDGQRFQCEGLGFGWVVEALGSSLNKPSGRAFRICPVGDRWLRPIRDPGDDARDESWAYLPPVPTTTKKPEHA
jgi:hypothetical protein